MKKMLGLMLYAVLMFGVTAGLGMFMMKKSATVGHGSAEHDSEADSEHGAADPSSHTGGDAVEIEHEAVVSHSGETPERESAGGHQAVSESHSPHPDDEQLPVAVRASPMSVEEIVRMGLSLKSRDEVVRKREDALRETEAQQRLVLSDIAAAQQEIENLLAQTSDQRAAKEELLARLMAQNETLTRERKGIADEKQQLLAEHEKLDAARKQLEAEKTSLAQSENELLLKRRELDADRQQFAIDQTKVKVDGEKLIKDREAWIAEQEKIASEKKQLTAERDQLRVDRELLDQEKRAFASSSGTSGGSAGANTPVLDDATRQKNLKSMAQMFEAMSADVAASSVRELAAGGNHDMVVDVLLLLEQRKAGAIMDALDDDKLSSEFLLRINSRNSAPKAAKKP